MTDESPSWDETLKALLEAVETPSYNHPDRLELEYQDGTKETIKVPVFEEPSEEEVDEFIRKMQHILFDNPPS